MSFFALARMQYAHRTPVMGGVIDNILIRLPVCDFCQTRWTYDSSGRALGASPQGSSSARRDLELVTFRLQ
jgi:hypothetical protein